MKRFIVALIAGGAVFALAFGAAATLGVSGGTIQAGVDASLYCDNDGVQVLGWGLETDDGKVYFVRIGGVDSDCAGNDLFVRVSDGSGALIGPSFSQLIPGGGGEVKVPFPGGLPASAIEDIHVYIEGSVGD